MHAANLARVLRRAHICLHTPEMIKALVDVSAHAVWPSALALTLTTLVRLQMEASLSQLFTERCVLFKQCRGSTGNYYSLAQSAGIWGCTNANAVAEYQSVFHRQTLHDKTLVHGLA